MTTLRIACIGRAGQTAQALAAVAAHNRAIALMQSGREQADLANHASLARFIDRANADVVINTGAYNAVDRAEAEEAIAFAVNAEGPRALARLCAERGLPFIHMSTDCVFDGRASAPYREEEEPIPLSAYGRSKLAGEQAVAEENPDALTVRVAWVFSEYGDNFVSKMIELARTRPKLRVVRDQSGPPTYAPDIAAALIKAAREKASGVKDLSGLMHVVSSDALNRADMARAIMAESRAQGGPFAEIEGVTTAEFNAPAARPLNARLSNAKAVRRLGLSFRPWPEALTCSVAGVLARN
jgi:dTDP-4-dehydrorhamnose reductase